MRWSVRVMSPGPTYSLRGIPVRPEPSCAARREVTTAPTLYPLAMAGKALDAPHGSVVRRHKAASTVSLRSCRTRYWRLLGSGVG